MTKNIADGRKIGTILAGFIGSGMAIFFIGFFQLLAEASEAVKAALTIHSGIGPLSGKVMYGYSLGLVVFLIAYAILRNKTNARIQNYVYFLILMLILGTLFSYTPFTDFLLGK